MHALGIPTTRALAAVSTGEPVFRDRQLAGAVLTRVASSHIRMRRSSHQRAHECYFQITESMIWWLQFIRKETKNHVAVRLPPPRPSQNPLTD
jgi:uncharacterized protein YdiU (UPF0061 family)